MSEDNSKTPEHGGKSVDVKAGRKHRRFVVRDRGYSASRDWCGIGARWMVVDTMHKGEVPPLVLSEVEIIDPDGTLRNVPTMVPNLNYHEDGRVVNSFSAKWNAAKSAREHNTSNIRMSYEPRREGEKGIFDDLLPLPI
jgi:hypothetical protein